MGQDAGLTSGTKGIHVSTQWKAPATLVPAARSFLSIGNWAYERQWGMGFFVEERSSFSAVDNAGKS